MRKDVTRLGLLSAALAAFIGLSGCVAFMPDRIHYVWDEAGAKAESEGADAAEHGGFVGLAFSGGGSRAAVFAAAGAEALNREGHLPRVTHVSSVSGGSMAAAYLAASPPEECATRDPSCTDRYFADYQTAMRVNYFWPMEYRQVIHPNRFLSPTRRVTSLGESFDRKYLDNRTFGDLSDDRVFMFNAASYDDSRRFIFSNAVLPQIEPKDYPLAHPALRGRSFVLGNCTAPTPDDFPLSLAVAASAAFPPALGPVAIEVPPACGNGATQYWHLGDGGILENTGVESLQEFLLRQAATGREPEYAIIFAFDAGKKESPEINLADRDLRLWTSDPGRVVSITNTRADAYWSVVWEQTKRQLPFPARVISIRYTDHVPAEWPASCPRRKRRSDRIAEHLRQVPTRFSITTCDADLISASAHLGVERALSAHAETLGLLVE